MSAHDTSGKPFRLVPKIHEELENVFQSIIDKPWGRVPRATWNPAVDLHETPEEYILLADLPGVCPSDVEIEVLPHEVTVCGTRKSLHRTEAARRLCIERACGRFCRVFHLECSVVPHESKATMKEGIYEVHLKKTRSP